MGGCSSCLRHLGILWTFLFLISCSGYGTDTSSTTAGGGSGTGGSGSSEGGSTGSTGSSGSGGTSGSGFTVSGQLSSVSVSSLDLEGVLKDSATGTVTDVVAVSPEPGNANCKIASVDSSGSFQLPLTSGRPWMMSFMDRNRLGSMFLGMFRFSGFSNFGTLWPNRLGGSLDLGRVSVSGADGTVSSSVSDSSILSSLNLDSETSDAMRSLGNMAERYRNPDMDGNGKPDCSESGKKFMLDFHVRFAMKQNGVRATVSDIIDNFLSETSTVPAYTGTGIYAAYPSTYSSATSGSVTFADSDVTTSEGGLIKAGTPTSAVTANNFSNYYGFGPNATADSELPSGKIIFSFGDKALTFTGVQTPTLAQITAPTGRIFPFVKISKSDPACTSNCTIGSLSYKWMKKTANGWTPASLTELGLVISDNGGYVSLRLKNDGNKVIGFTLPLSSPSGTIAWDSSKANLSGVTAAELGSMTTAQICHFGLSCDDRLGMRYFEGIDDASGTCL